LIVLASGLVTENRKNNAISKLGRVKTNDQKDKLERLLSDDVLETLQEKVGESEDKEKGKGGRRQTLWEKLSNREKQEVTEHVKTLVRDFLASGKKG
jgi:T4 RNA ligase 2 C-terminal